jgi:hypothetical protein
MLPPLRGGTHRQKSEPLRRVGAAIRSRRLLRRSIRRTIAQCPTFHPIVVQRLPASC